MSTARYIEQLNERINAALKEARINSEAAQLRMKSNYDRNSSVRELQPGDLALILLPTCGNKLIATWSGPHKVLRRCEN